MFHADYWAAVDAFHALGVSVSTSYDGSPMPTNSAVGVAMFAMVPLGALGALIGGAGIAHAAGTLRYALLGATLYNVAIAGTVLGLLCPCVWRPGP